MRSGARDSLAVFALALLLYVTTLYPDVAGGDSGELVGAVLGGGVIHPPGYPAYALLGRVFLHLPLGNVAWRLNLMSAVCDAGAAAVVFLATWRCTRSRGAALAAAALFALAPGVWRYAICAEVFALNNLIVAVLLYLAVRYVETREPRHSLLGAFVVGLGLSNHHTVVFTAAPLAAWVIWVGRRDLLRPTTVGLATLAFAAGLLPYVYLPVAAARHAVVTWGAANTWAGFWTHVLRREYGTFQLAPTGIAGPGPTGTETLGAFADETWDALGWIGASLAAVGLAASLRELTTRRARAVVAASEGWEAWRSHAPLVAVAPVVLSVGVMVALGNLPVGDAMHRAIVARFWQQPVLLLCVICGAGLAAAGRRLRLAGTSPRRVALAELGAAGVLAVLELVVRRGAMDRSTSTLVRQYGAAYLAAAPPGALLVTKGDLITNTVRYLQLADRARPDVTVVDQELLGMSWMAPEVARRFPDVMLPAPRYAPGAADGFAMKQLLDANAGRSPILICGGIKAGDSSADATYGQWPFGFCEWMRSGEEPVNLDEWIRDSEAALPRIDFAGQPRPGGSWEEVVWSDYWEVRQARAAHLITVAGRDEARRKYIALAAEILQSIVAENPGVPIHVYKNLAIALGRSGLESPDRRARAADAWQHYLDGTSNGDPQRPAIQKEVERLRSTPR